MSDPVNHPSHYGGFSNGAEVIDITECLNFNRGNAVKYITRAGAKDPDKEIEDLEKARWYLNREIKRLGGEEKPYDIPGPGDPRLKTVADPGQWNPAG